MDQQAINNKMAIEMFNDFTNKGLSVKEASILTQLTLTEMNDMLSPSEKELMDKFQKKLKAEREQILMQLTEIDEMVNDGVIDEYYAAHIKDDIDPGGLGQQPD